MAASDHLIVALDVDSLKGAEPLVAALAPYVGYFKIGLELLTSVGAPQVVQWVHERGSRVFFDGKFNDIPNTVAKASKAVASLGVAMFDVHASSGKEAMRAAVKHRGKSAVLAVTVLTALDDETSSHIFGQRSGPKVKQFVKDALEAGVQGIVCSPQELALLSDISGSEALMKITPGVRPAWAEAGDQKRVLTPKEAISLGATHLVIGRPITEPPKTVGSPLDAAKRILAEIEEALA